MPVGQTTEREHRAERRDPERRDRALALTPPRARRICRLRRRDAVYRRSLAVADMVAAGIAFSFSAVVLGEDQLTPATLAVLPLVVIVAKAMGLYDRDEHLLHRSTLDEVPSLFVIATLGALLLWLSDDLLIDGELGRRQVVGTWALLFVLMIALRSLARWASRALTPPERCLLLGNPSRAIDLQSQLALAPGTGELVGVLGGNGTATEGLHDELQRTIVDLDVDRVVLVPGSRTSDEVMFVIRELKAVGVKVSVMSDASRVAGSSVEVDQVGGLTLLGMRRFEITRSSLIVKRAFDLVVSTALLAVLSPLLIAIAIAIKLDSRGPVLFAQRRIGRADREFQMLKFRSMRRGADELKDELRHLDRGAPGLFKIPDDPRVTRVGRWLRRWSLDELPQLVNVFAGDMSLVGPRPLVPEEDLKVEGMYRRRLDVPPGMTGHWQVLGSARIPLEEMVKLDYLYGANWSLWEDMRVLLRTLPVVVGRRGM